MSEFTTRGGKRVIYDKVSMDNLSCPQCGRSFDADAALGADIVAFAGYGRDTMLGDESVSHRFGNCPHCFAMIELVNGRLARTMLVLSRLEQPKRLTSRPGHRKLK